MGRPIQACPYGFVLRLIALCLAEIYLACVRPFHIERVGICQTVNVDVERINIIVAADKAAVMLEIYAVDFDFAVRRICNAAGYAINAVESDIAVFRTNPKVNCGWVCEWCLCRVGVFILIFCINTVKQDIADRINRAALNCRAGIYPDSASRMKRAV